MQWPALSCLHARASVSSVCMHAMPDPPRPISSAKMALTEWLSSKASQLRPMSW